jgi:hypothetical protein
VPGAKGVDKRGADDPCHLIQHRSAWTRCTGRRRCQQPRPSRPPWYVEHVEEPLEPGLDCCQRVGGTGHDPPQRPTDRFGFAEHERLEQRLFGVEVAVEGAGRQPRFGQQFVERDLRVVVALDNSDRRINQEASFCLVIESPRSANNRCGRFAHLVTRHRRHFHEGTGRGRDNYNSIVYRGVRPNRSEIAVSWVHLFEWTFANEPLGGWYVHWVVNLTEGEGGQLEGAAP